MNCRLLSEKDYHTLFLTFNAAFSNNFVKLQPTEKEFLYRINEKIRIENDISAGSFDGAEMLGFIIHSSNSYQGIPTAYNGGTGVLPGFRNQKIAEELYEFLIPKIQSRFLARILLEVVEVNEYAIKLYEKIGFNFKRRMLCFKQTKQISNPDPALTVERASITDVDFDFNDFEPSFIDSEAHLKSGNEHVLACKIDGNLAGFSVLQPHLGRVSQLAVDRKYRGMHVGRSLLHHAQTLSKKKLTIMNIPEDQFNFHSFLKRCGFANEVNQFEMELII